MEGYIENTSAQMRKGSLEFCILLIIKNEEVYASEILLKLKDANLIVVEGTVYPILARLRKAGLVEYTWKESKSGPPRKYYTLTISGENVVKKLSESWENLSASVKALGHIQ